MTKNTGKRFESDFKASVPDKCLLIRLNDPPQSFGGGSARFSIKNPCDYLAFDSKRRIFVPLELKTTKYKSISYEDVNLGNQPSRMIHKHQIEGLTGFAKYEHCHPGFIFNFRDENNCCERCYFQHINDFNDMTNNIDKKSCNEIDILRYGAIKIEGYKKRTRYSWDINKLLEDISNKFYNR